MAGDQKNQNYYLHDGYVQGLYQNGFLFSVDEAGMCQQQDHWYREQNDRKWTATFLLKILLPLPTLYFLVRTESIEQTMRNCDVLQHLSGPRQYLYDAVPALLTCTFRLLTTWFYCKYLNHYFDELYDDKKCRL